MSSNLFVDETITCNEVQTILGNEINDYELREIISRWSVIDTCRISRIPCFEIRIELTF